MFPPNGIRCGMLTRNTRNHPAPPKLRTVRLLNEVIPVQTVSQPPKSLSQMIAQRDVVIDQNLPAWARRSNPIVRRELGDNWKRLFPNLSLMARLIALQIGMVLVLPLGFLMTLTLPVAVLSIALTPALLFIYGRLVVVVINSGAESMVNANVNYTLDLLRVSTLPIETVILGKIAASIWRGMDDLDLALMGVSVFSLPLMAIYYLGGLRPEEVLIGHRVMVSMGMIVIPLRLMLEPFMIGAVAVAAGTVINSRAGAVISTAALVVFYYLLLTIPAFALLDWGTRVILELVLPVIVPLIISLAAIQLVRGTIARM